MTLSQIFRTPLIAIAGFLTTAVFHTGAVAQANSPQGVRNIVIVHGAWADGSSWSKVIPLLQAKGLHEVAVQNPLTSLADDVAATKRAIALQDGPVLLVGHSYGGVVITEAGNDPKVVGLVYVAALAPSDGGSVEYLFEERDVYLAGEPAHDDRFLAAFAHALEHTGGYTLAEAKRVARTLLPDVLSYDPTSPASFPDNGRALTDDAFDSFIRILTNGKVTEDKVGPHGDLLLEFPYVGPPHMGVSNGRA
jgi:pimeloyl-ACP methyl ester carboxylesterase